MKCPTDGTTLTMSERSGIEIDYCPECRGVWLDRGELDKILDRAASESPAAPGPQAPPEPRYAEPRYEEPRYREPRYEQRPTGYRPRKKKESWLTELFD